MILLCHLGVNNIVRTPFPLYWQKVYDIMEKIDRKLKVFEIGCGQGDVTTIFCYLGFS